MKSSVIFSLLFIIAPIAQAASPNTSSSSTKDKDKDKTKDDAKSEAKKAAEKKSEAKAEAQKSQEKANAAKAAEKASEKAAEAKAAAKEAAAKAASKANSPGASAHSGSSTGSPSGGTGSGVPSGSFTGYDDGKVKVVFQQPAQTAAQFESAKTKTLTLQTQVSTVSSEKDKTKTKITTITSEIAAANAKIASISSEKSSIKQAQIAAEAKAAQLNEQMAKLKAVESDLKTKIKDLETKTNDALIASQKNKAEAKAILAAEPAKAARLNNLKTIEADCGQAKVKLNNEIDDYKNQKKFAEERARIAAEKKLAAQLSAEELKARIAHQQAKADAKTPTPPPLPPAGNTYVGGGYLETQVREAGVVGKSEIKMARELDRLFKKYDTPPFTIGQPLPGEDLSKYDPTAVLGVLNSLTLTVNSQELLKDGTFFGMALDDLPKDAKGFWRPMIGSDFSGGVFFLFEDRIEAGNQTVKNSVIEHEAYHAGNAYMVLRIEEDIRKLTASFQGVPTAAQQSQLQELLNHQTALTWSCPGHNHTIDSNSEEIANKIDFDKELDSDGDGVADRYLSTYTEYLAYTATEDDGQRWVELVHQDMGLSMEEAQGALDFIKNDPTVKWIDQQHDSYTNKILSDLGIDPTNPVPNHAPASVGN